MRISMAVLLVAGLLICVGCRGQQPGGSPFEAIKPALLIGPEAVGQASPPLELPNKEGARLCMRTAEEFEKNGQVADAIRLYEKARVDDPTTAKTTSRRLAVLYDKAGEFTKAVTEYESLLQVQPKDADLWNDLGYSHYCRGDWANAETCLTRATVNDPNHKRAWCNLGLAQAQQEKWDDSFRSFTKAVRPADAYCNMAFVMAARGKLDDAKAHYAQALKLDPSLRMAQAALAKLDNPKQVGVITAAKVKPASVSKYDLAEAAAKVPSIAELEARLQREGRLPGSPQTPQP